MPEVPISQETSLRSCHCEPAQTWTVFFAIAIESSSGCLHLLAKSSRAMVLGLAAAILGAVDVEVSLLLPQPPRNTVARVST